MNRLSASFALVSVDTNTGILNRYECSHGTDPNGGVPSSKRRTDVSRIVMWAPGDADLIERWRSAPAEFKTLVDQAGKTNTEMA